jgi:hypothetical protein
LPDDRQWLDAIVSYLKGREMGFAYWSLNPSSVGTDGLLEDDYATPKQEKYDALGPLLR